MSAGRLSHRVDYTGSPGLFFLEPLRRISGLRLYRVGRQKPKQKLASPKPEALSMGREHCPDEGAFLGLFVF